MLLLNLMVCPLGYLVGSCSDKKGCNKRLFGLFILGQFIYAVQLGAWANIASCQAEYNEALRHVKNTDSYYDSTYI